MSDDRTARINTAVDAILEHCLAAERPPRAVLADCLRDLVADPRWSPLDIEAVQSAVKKVLDERGL